MRVRNLRRKIIDYPGYDPAPLFARVFEVTGCKNANQLSKIIDVSPPVLSRVIRSRFVLSAEMLIRIHEVSGISIGELKSLAHMPSFQRKELK